ncbi:endo-1,4-beta-xylanase [Microbacterium karelineae]|uniref:endo-1,4-beta-xylanase n=1 Tax=Microbacterium karelineae TaxID=2654283 RepID=UPI0012EA6EC1|nr:endo-1,4-beta-xylanase [Microbacterium karelineae]
MRTRTISMLVGGATAFALLAGSPALAAPPAHAPGLAAKDTLAAVAPDGLRIGGAAAGGGHHGAADYPDPFTSDEPYRDLLAAEFTSLTPENQMKWDHLRPSRDEFAFDDADAIVDFAEENGQIVRGHTLFWHSQNPAWLEDGDYSDAELREILHEHISTVVGRYAGRVAHWEVANEIFDDAGNLRTEENIWIRELGPEIIADAFRWAHEADPEAVLFFNDYNVEGLNPKADAYYALIQDLLADGVPVDGMGLQSHLGTMYGYDPTLPENLARFGALGLETAITELDVRMEIADGAEPTPEQVADQNEFFEFVLTSCLEESSCGSFTLWGASDLYSWVPNTFEGQGSATPWTEDLERKSAYCVLQTTLLSAQPGGEARAAHHPAYAGCRAA